jgi:hypothetical protein
VHVFQSQSPALKRLKSRTGHIPYFCEALSKLCDKRKEKEKCNFQKTKQN